MNKITDTKGNYLTVSYLEDNANGSFRPSTIAYTGNATAGKTPGMSVQFSYDIRADTRPYHVGGVALKQLYRLSNIKTYVGATVVKDYRLSYLANSNVQYSTLSGLTECLGTASCLASKTFEHTAVTNTLAVGSVISGVIDWGASSVLNGVWKEKWSDKSEQRDKWKLSLF